MKITAKGAQALALLDGIAQGGQVKESAILSAEFEARQDARDEELRRTDWLDAIFTWAAVVLFAAALLFSWMLD